MPDATPTVNSNSKGVGPVVDPTKNVLDLVEASIKRQDDLREAEAKFQNMAREAESRRLADLAAMMVRYEEVIEKVRQTSLDNTAQLLTSQLQEMKRDMAERVASLEQFRWETGGRGTGRTDFLGWIVSAALVGGFILTYFAANT